MTSNTLEGIRISVIIPIKNRAALIVQTLESIMNQTLKPVEIILVDDGSTDGLADVLASYSNTIIYMENSGVGPGAARNTGLKVATGDYIKFFDSDDLMSPTSLFDQMHALLKSNKKFVTSPYFYAFNQGNSWVSPKGEILNYHPIPHKKSLQHYMIWGLFIPIPSMLFSKAFLKEIGDWPENITTSEDWIYLWRIAQKEPYPAHTNTCAFIYRLHEQQSTGGNMDDLSRDKEKFEILLEIYHSYIQSGGFLWMEKAIFRTKFYQIATVTKDETFKKELQEAAGKGICWLWMYVKIKMKWGRVITKSDWQPMHGMMNDDRVMKTYLSWFN